MFENSTRPVGRRSTSLMLCLLAGLILGGDVSADDPHLWFWVTVPV